MLQRSSHAAAICAYKPASAAVPQPPAPSRSLLPNSWSLAPAWASFPNISCGDTEHGRDLALSLG